MGWSRRGAHCGGYRKIVILPFLLGDRYRWLEAVQHGFIESANHC